MNGRAYVAVARQPVQGPDKSFWLAGAGRAYDGLLWEAWTALERWGFAIPPHVNIHFHVRLSCAVDPEAQLVGRGLEKLGDLRNRADYRRTFWRESQSATEAVIEAEENVARLDPIEADPQLRAAAIAGIRPPP